MKKKTFDGLVQGIREMQAMERRETAPGARENDVKRNSATYTDRRQKAGWRRVAVWVPEDRVADLRAFAEEIGKDKLPARPVLGSRWEKRERS